MYVASKTAVDDGDTSLVLEPHSTIKERVIRLEVLFLNSEACRLAINLSQRQFMVVNNLL